MGAVVWPTHAYVPGKTPRHPEDAFEAIRQTAQAGMGADALAASAAFVTGVRYLDGGYYWEAHELLEPVWMVLPDPSAERALVQGLIQIANGFLKLEMDRPKAAARLVTIARDLVPAAEQGVLMGMQVSDVRGRIDSLQMRIAL